MRCGESADEQSEKGRREITPFYNAPVFSTVLPYCSGRNNHTILAQILGNSVNSFIVGGTYNTNRIRRMIVHALREFW